LAIDENGLVLIDELQGHTETVEFASFNFDGSLCVTGGFNNQLRVWKRTDLSQGMDPKQEEKKISSDDDFLIQDQAKHTIDLQLKCVIDAGPDPKDDMNFVSWHPKGNLLLTGGKDTLIWLINGVNG